MLRSPHLAWLAALTAICVSMSLAGRIFAEVPTTSSEASPPAADAVRLPSSKELWNEEPVAVGCNKQLLVDDYVIAHRYNIERDLNQATKANNGKPVLVCDKPWEPANCFQVQTVRRVNGKFVMHYLYTGCPADYCCQAISDDGVHWTKPQLGLREFSGDRNNNLLDHQGAILFLDPHETDPAHKFKSTFRPMEGSTDPHATCLGYSADSLHWYSYNDGHPVTKRAADTLHQMVWDERAQVYRLFSRTDFGADGKPSPTDSEFRGNREMINPDVKADPTDWTTVREWKFDREGPNEVRRRQIHTVNFWQYEGIDFGIMSVMEWPADTQRAALGPEEDRHERDNWNCYLATRRGGHESDWDLRWIYDEKPLIPRGPDGAFDKDMVHSASTIVTWDDQHWIYYTGWPNGHIRHPYKPAIGLARVPLDRFVYLEPWRKAEPGWVITKPFQIEGSRLELNADANQGSIAVEVLDEQGKPITGFTRSDAVTIDDVDGLRMVAKWKDTPDLKSLVGKTVRLKFYLDGAKLYAFQLAKND